MRDEHSSSWFVRAAAVIGDLSNPFYREERQRDVWNEASAVALQVLLWLSLLAATAAVWIVGADALPYVHALIGMVAVAGWIAVGYAWSLGVHVEDSKARWPRMTALVVLAAVLLAGLVRAHDVQFRAVDPSTAAGMVTGALTVVVLFAAAARWARRRSRGREQD